MSGQDTDMVVAESSGSRATTRSGKHGHSRSGDVDVAGKNMSRPKTIKPRNGAVSFVETAEAKRDRLLAEKQAEMESIVDRHDDLVRLLLAGSQGQNLMFLSLYQVREMFHMENFTMMLSFDPPVSVFMTVS